MTTSSDSIGVPLGDSSPRLQIYPDLTESLPAEILSTIFLDLVQEEFYSKSEGKPTMFYPRALAAVCGRWRSLCLDTPSLWAYFRPVSAHWADDRPGQEPAPFLTTRLQLQRSRNASLYIYEAGMYPDRIEALILQLLAFQAAPRWKMLKLAFFHIPHSYPSRPLPTLMPVGQVLSSLQEISFTGFKAYIWSQHLLLLNSQTLPNIRVASFSYLTTPANSNMVHSFPWERLRSLCLPEYYGGFDELTTILSQCTSLTTLQLSFHNSVIAEHAHFNRDAPSLARLTHLDLKNGERDTIPPFPHLKAPNLQHLQYGPLCPPIIADFTNFITPSANSLTSLNIQHPLWFEMGYLRIFELLQQLEHLAVYPPNDPPQLVMTDCNMFLEVLTRRMHASSANTGILPRLRRLELHDLAFNPFLLSRMVESRLSIPRPSETAALGSSLLSLVTLKALEIDHQEAAALIRLDILSRVANILGKYVDEGKLELKICNLKAKEYLDMNANRTAS